MTAPLRAKALENETVDGKVSQILANMKRVLSDLEKSEQDAWATCEREVPALQSLIKAKEETIGCLQAEVKTSLAEIARLKSNLDVARQKRAEVAALFGCPGERIVHSEAREETHEDGGQANPALRCSDASPIVQSETYSPTTPYRALFHFPETVVRKAVSLGLFETTEAESNSQLRISRKSRGANQAKRKHRDTSPESSANEEHWDRDVKRSRKSQHTETIEFDEVFQSGQAKYKHTILEEPKRSGKFYILRCDKHNKHFGYNAAICAGRHLSRRDHGSLRQGTSVAVKNLGIRVLNCDSAKARLNNDIFKDALDRGYKVFEGAASPQECRPGSPLPYIRVRVSEERDVAGIRNEEGNINLRTDAGSSSITCTPQTTTSNLLGMVGGAGTKDEKDIVDNERLCFVSSKIELGPAHQAAVSDTSDGGDVYEEHYEDLSIYDEEEDRLFSSRASSIDHDHHVDPALHDDACLLPEQHNAESCTEVRLANQSRDVQGELHQVRDDEGAHTQRAQSLATEILPASITPLRNTSSPDQTLVADGNSSNTRRSQTPCQVKNSQAHEFSSNPQQRQGHITETMVYMAQDAAAIATAADDAGISSQPMLQAEVPAIPAKPLTIESLCESPHALATDFAEPLQSHSPPTESTLQTASGGMLHPEIQDPCFSPARGYTASQAPQQVPEAISVSQPNEVSITSTSSEGGPIRSLDERRPSARDSVLQEGRKVTGPHTSVQNPAYWQQHEPFPLTTQLQSGQPVLTNKTHLRSSHVNRSEDRRAPLLCPAPISYSSFLPHLQRHLDTDTSANQQLSALERARFALVRDACAREDGFYLAFHQLFCLWSSRRRDAYDHIACSQNSVDRGFQTMGEIMEDNENLGPTNLAWFSRFPVVLKGYTSIPGNYSHSIDAVAIFLLRLTTSWPALRKAPSIRRYPLLVNELRVVLNCTSPVLQTILFHVSIDDIGISGGIYGSEIERLFTIDLQAHMGDEAQSDRGEIDHRFRIRSSAEEHDRKLIDEYRQALRNSQQPSQSDTSMSRT